ncbi:MAG: hypothetical protein WCW26_02635 [Candidatus Buchananbacteria bacterium]
MSERLEDQRFEQQVYLAAESLCETPEETVTSWRIYQRDRRFGKALEYLADNPFFYRPFVITASGQAAFGRGLGWYQAVMRPEKIRLSVQVLTAEVKIYDLRAFAVNSEYYYGQDRLKFPYDLKSFQLLMRDFWLVPIENGYPLGILRLALKMSNLPKDGFFSQTLAAQSAAIGWSFSESACENLVVMATCAISTRKEQSDYVRLDLTVIKPPK